MLKVSKSTAILRWSGRTFQSVGVQTEKDRSPYFELDRKTSRRPLDEDRNGRVGTHLSKSSVIYLGAS